MRLKKKQIKELAIELEAVNLDKDSETMPGGATEIAYSWNEANGFKSSAIYKFEHKFYFTEYPNHYK